MMAKSKAQFFLTPASAGVIGWIPGRALRTATVLLLCLFCAMALTVNYAADGGLFLLAGLGLYVGFRRGFVSGLGACEKMLIVAFATYPTIAIASYLAGSQTDMGFRLLGRDLRFFLFIPVYLALRWSFPRREAVGWAFATGAVAAGVSAAVSVLCHSNGFRAQGVTGVSITFGDLSLMSGFLGACLLLGKSDWQARLGACVSIAAGLAASTLSGSRGGWIAIPPMALMFALGAATTGVRRLAAALAVGSVAVMAALAAIPGTPVATRGREAMDQVSLYFERARDARIPAGDFFARCPNDFRFLSALASGIGQWTRGKPLPVRVVRDPPAFRGSPWKERCRSDYLFEVSKSPSSRGWTTLVVPRSVATGGRQRVAILAAGSGMLRSATADRHLRFDTGALKEIRGSFDLPDYQPLLVSLLPGDSLLFVPLQLSPGAYYYYYAANPVGLRLEMWRAAGEMFMRHPLLGVGTGGFRDFATRMIRTGKLAPGVVAFDHPHDDYMAALAQRGVLGLAVLLGLLAAPLATLRGDGGKGAAGAAVVLAVGWAVFALSETMFVHSLVISWFLIVVAAVTALHFSGADTKYSPHDPG